MQMACGGRQRHVEEFRSKRGEHFEPSCLCSGVFFRNQKACRNNSSKNHLYITEKGLPNTTGRTSAKSENSDTHRNENLTISDREPILSRSRSRIQWAGFSHEGHGPQCKKCMGTLAPRCFPAGTWILPTLKFLSKYMRLRSLGGMRLKGASTSIIKLENVYRGIRKKKFTDYRKMSEALNLTSQSFILRQYVGDEYFANHYTTSPHAYDGKHFFLPFSFQDRW